MTKTTKTTKQALMTAVANRFPEAAMTHGWHLAGAGPARFGWGLMFPGGKTLYLGATAFAALQYVKAQS